MMRVGIDNGVSGGVVAISETRLIIDMITMPTKRGRKGNEVDVRELYRWLSELTGGDLSIASYVIEEPGGSKSAKAGASMAGSFHAVRGMFETKLLRWERITPQSWQKEMIPGCKAGETKPRAISRASELWPTETFIPAGRRVPHLGLVDAALIAEYSRLKNL